MPRVKERKTHLDLCRTKGVKNMNKKEAHEDMRSLYDCETCYNRSAVVKVSGTFTCYECWAKEQKELSQ